ncbi:MAG: mechanosensitive ion channel family protein [Afipia sp.]|nr:mechanosensitive ion channel family protein [Afipia sp.]
MSAPDNPVASAPAAAKPSLTEQVIASTTAGIDHLLALDPRDVALNLLASAVIIGLAVVLVWAVRRLMDHWLAKVSAPGAEPDEPRTQKAARLTWALFRLSVALAVVGLLLGLWGIDVQAWLSGGAGARLARLVLVVLLATALVEVSGFAIKRLVEGFARRSGDPGRAAQLRTLGPLLTGSAQTILVVVGVLTVLTELGLKVGPILASAGVLGIAVGFGAQTLVKDFLTGVFLIAEDVVSVGDNVQIGDFGGVVEAMTLRTIRLRDANATLHIFPYSEAQVIHNRTKIYSAYLADIPVSYDNDLEHALAVVREVGEGLKADPKFGRLITQPFEVMGVDRLADNAVYLKARLVTRPRAQWEIGREFNLRLKSAFDREGVLTPVKTTPVAARSLDEQRDLGDPRGTVAAPDNG